MSPPGCTIRLPVEDGDNSETIVHSTFNVAVLRRGRIDVFAGRAIHKLRPDGDSYKIAYKKVLLINNDQVINNLTFLIYRGSFERF